MFRNTRFTLTIAVSALGTVCIAQAAPTPKRPDLGALPMLFEANRGQGPRDAEFLSRGAGYTVTFGRDEVRIGTGKAIVGMRILGASKLLRIEGTEQQQAKTNYFMGNVPDKWLTSIPNYSHVRYSGVYPGIDLVFYGNGRQLEYDWIVSPGADPSQIRTRFEGVDKMHVDASGDLLLKLKKDRLSWRRPSSYQSTGDLKTGVRADFRINRRYEVAFVLGDYDHSKPLVIDPILSYATYLGGSGADYAFSLAVDSQGNAYIAGTTYSPDFPLAVPYQNSIKVPNGQSAGFITKINPQGTALVYSTFIGGTMNSGATAIAVDSQGFAYVGGGTASTDFPTVNPFQNHNNGGVDNFVLKLSQNGSTLIFSSYFGGANDEFVQGLALDSANNIYMTGWTQSQTLFPLVNAIQSTYGGSSHDAFITKVNAAGSAIVYSTYVGGNGDDNSFGISVDSLNQAFIAGQTSSTNFPTQNAAQGTYHGGGNDVFVTAVNAAGTGYVYSTYLGGDDQDRARAIYVDPQSSNAYVTGDTQSPIHANGLPFPTSADAYQSNRASCAPVCVGGSADVFLTRLSATGAIVYSTYFGGAVGFDCSATATYGCGADKGVGITLDPMGDIFIGGTTNSTDFPTASPTQVHNSGGYDAFVIKFSPDGHQLLFSTYFGGSGTDYAYNLARTQSGEIYVSGWASNSFNFPHSGTPPLFTYGGGIYDGFVMKLSNADIFLMKHGFQVRTSSAFNIAGIQPQAIPGGNYSYTTDMLNSASSENADNGVMTVAVTGPTTIDSCTSSAGTCNAATNPVTVSNIPTFTAGTSIQVTLNGHVNPTANPGDQVGFKFYGLSDTNDPNPTNNVATDGFTVATSCVLSLLNYTTTFGSTGGTGIFSISSPCDFGWTASTPVNWVIAPVSGGNGGPFTFTVLPNPTLARRSTTLNLSGASFTITQSAPRLSIVLYDKNNGQEYTALTNSNGTYTYVPNLFQSAFTTMRTGDFNGDGKTDLVMYNSQTALAYIGFGNGDGTYTFQSLFWSPGYDIVESGDLNGDGKTDFALYNSSTGTMYTGISNGDGTFTYKYTLITSGYTFLRLADFTGDGKADIFLYNAATGQANLGVSDGAGSFAFHALGMSPGYNLADLGDLNGDGKMDIVVYNSANGNSATGISDGLGGLTFTPLITSAGFTSVRLADYTGDGKADVTVYNQNTSAAYFGTGNGAGNFTFQSLFWSPAYDLVVPQDVNGDGKMDIILYNSSTGTEYTGISNGVGQFTYTYSLWGPGKTLAR